MIKTIASKITFLFVICLVLLCSLFVGIFTIQVREFENKEVENLQNAISYLLILHEKSNLPKDWEHYFSSLYMEYIKNEKLKNAVLNSGEILSMQNTPIGNTQIIIYNDKPYLSIKNPGFNILITNLRGKTISDSLWIGFGVVIAILILLYTSVLRSLNPLSKLRADIKKFASGDIEWACSNDISKGFDEVTEVSYEFHKAACKIKELLMSRQLFLRTIMHELKTPIGKGRIVAEMVEDEMQKERFIAIFERLNLLINEFAKIEQLVSKSYSLTYQECYFEVILEQVKDMLLLDKFDEKVICDIKDSQMLRVDFQLFSLAIKNLIDNALKYCDEDRVYLKFENNKIEIKNLGKQLERPIEHYFQAFVREQGSKHQGMGLGLYIIEHIFNMHKFKLEYSYENGYHIFRVDCNA